MPKQELTPKFNIGDRVKEKGAPEIEAGKVIKFTFDSDSGFRYQFESKEVDVVNKKIIHGFKDCPEGELEAAKKVVKKDE